MKKAILLGLYVVNVHLICQAQVPVSQEPRHHKVLSNAHIRLLDVRIPRGDTSQFHIHSTPSVFVLLSSAKSGSEVIVEEDRSKYPVHHYDNIYFDGFYTQSRIHRVWNSDTSEFHVMDIELPNQKYIDIDPPINNPSFFYLFEEKPVRAYRIVLRDEAFILLPGRKADVLLICLKDSVTGVSVNKTSLRKKGDFLYLPSGIPIEIKKYGKPECSLAFFELK